MSVRLVTACVQSSLAAAILSVVMSVIVAPDTLMTDSRIALVRTQYHKRFKQLYVSVISTLLQNPLLGTRLQSAVISIIL